MRIRGTAASYVIGTVALLVVGKIISDGNFLSSYIGRIISGLLIVAGLILFIYLYIKYM